MSVPRRLQRACWAFLAIGLLLKLVAVLFFPPHFDSNYYLNIGSNFIERGGLNHYMWRLPDEANIIAGGGTGYGVVVQALWFRIFGLSLFAGRLFSYLLGLGMLAAVFMTTRIWFGTSVAWYTLLFGGASSIFFASFTLRMDAAATFMYALILWLHIYAVYRRRAGIWHFGVGILAILSAEVHILGLVYVGGLAFYYGIEYLRQSWRERRLILRHPAIYYYLGALIAGIVYLVIHVLPNPDAYFLIPNACPFCEPRSIIREIGRFVNFFARYPVEALLFPLVGYAAFRRGRAEDQHFGLLLVGCWVSMMIVSQSNQSDYSTHWLPLELIGLATWFGFGFGHTFSMRWQRAANLTATAMLGVSIAFIYFWMSNAPSEDPRLAFVKENIPTDQVVMGNMLAYHQLLDYPLFLSYRDDERYTVLLNNETFDSFWQREKPTVFLPHRNDDPNYVDWRADTAWVQYMTDHDFKEVYPDVWVVPELAAVLGANTTR